MIGEITMSWKEILKRISERELLDAREFAEEDMARDVKHFRPDAWGGPGHTSYYSAKQIEAKELFDRWEKWIESHSEWINKQTDDVKELIKDMKENLEEQM